MRKVTFLIIAFGLICSFLLPQFALAQVTEAQLLELAEKLPKTTQLNVLGIASNTSEWGMLEKPYWEEMVPRLSKGKIKVKLDSITSLGVPGSQMLKLVSSGVYNVADTVASYAGEDIKELDAMDISGVSPTIEDIRKTTDAYKTIVDEALQKKARASILATWPTTGLVFWCRSKVTSLEDFKGKTVRVFSGTLANFVTALGGSSVSMPFAEMSPSLQRGVIDCGITGTASGNIAKLPEVTDYVYALNAGWAPQIRIVNTKWLAKQPKEVQEWLKLASQYFQDELAWPTQIRNHNMGIWCTSGDDRCVEERGFTKYGKTVTIPTDAELATVRDKVQSEVLPKFSKSGGNKIVDKWNSTIGKVIGVEMPK